MNKNDFMRALEDSLGSLSKDEKEDILYDYEEHFRIGIEKGKTEEEIAKELGDPHSIGKSYRAYTAVETASKNPSSKNIGKAILAAAALGFFNLVIVLGPFIGLVGVLIGLFAASACIAISGFCGIFGIIAQPFIPAHVHIGINPIAAFFLCIGLSSLGILLFIGMTYLGRFFLRGTIKYLKWNLSIIKK